MVEEPLDRTFVMPPLPPTHYHTHTHTHTPLPQHALHSLGPLPGSPHPKRLPSGQGISNNCSNSTFPMMLVSRRTYPSPSAKCWELGLPLLTLLSLPNTSTAELATSQLPNSLRGKQAPVSIHIPPNSSLCSALPGQMQLSRHPRGEGDAPLPLLP